MAAWNTSPDDWVIDPPTEPGHYEATYDEGVRIVVYEVAFGDGGLLFIMDEFPEALEGHHHRRRWRRHHCQVRRDPDAATIDIGEEQPS